MKRFLSFTLSVALLLSLAPTGIGPLTANAASNGPEVFTYEVHDGKATITGCTENIPFMEIPQTIDGYAVVGIGSQAFDECNDLREVTIPEGVETIEGYAFDQCKNLTALYLPNSLTSIGENAFRSCQSLERIDFGSGLKSIGYGAFSSCKKLDFYLEFPDGLESIGGCAFYNCDSLKTVLLPDSLNELGSKAFAMCDRLDYIAFPDHLSKIGSDVLYDSACYHYSNNWYGDAFYISSYLLGAKKSISGSYTTLKYITNIADGAFENCNKLTEVVLPDSLQIIGTSAFENCDALQRIIIPSGVRIIDDKAFYDCAGLKEIQLPDSIERLGRDVFTKTAYYKNEANWENYAFYVGNHLITCKPSLSGTLQVRNGTKTIVSGAMKGVTKLTELVLPDTLTAIGCEALAGCTALKKVTVSDSVTTIEEKAFYGCSSLKTVYLGKKVSQIGNSAFGLCSALESICVHSENEVYRSQSNCLIRKQDKLLVTGCKTSQIPTDGSVTGIGAFAFEGCTGLTELTIPDSILAIEKGAFRDCNALTTVHLGNGVQIVKERAFEECDVLSQVDFGHSVHTIENYGFAYNHQLKQLKFPSSLRHLGEEAFSNSTGLISVSFPEGLLSIGKNCFYFCENLTGLHLPDSLKEIKGGAFYGCERIATITFGKGLTSIGSAAFDGCKALVALALPASVQTIGNSAFYECTSLRQIDLGQVKQIGHSAFEACASLTQIHIPASVTTIGQSAFAYCPAIEQMTVSPNNPYYFSRDNSIIRTAEKALISGCKNSIIPSDGSVTSIAAYAFAGCKSLKRIIIPTQVKKIYAYAFYGCSGLQEMHLPFVGDGDSYLGYIFGASTPTQNDLYVPSSLKRLVILGGTAIGDSAFINCRGLQEIIFPETVTTIGYSAFQNCTSLERVVLPGNLQRLKDPAIFTGSSKAMLYISAGQENTITLVKSNNIPHRIGGLITFMDDRNQLIEKVWYSLNATISTPPVPGDDYTWKPVPGCCTGNQTIRLRHISQGSGPDKLGDFNGDMDVNNLDVEYLLWYTLFPDNYPIQFGADFNNDNEANNLDVEYLLWHTLFPETYPI